MAKSTVFISYAHEEPDINKAYKLYYQLCNAGLTPWLDKKCIKPGENWRTAVEREIKNSEYFIALLSRKSVTKRGFVQKEVKMALEVYDSLPESKIYLIPARLDESEPSHEALSKIQWTDLYPDWDEGVKKILSVIGGEFHRQKFWKNILGAAGEASVFLGAISTKQLNRELIGDWDLRTVSELTSYFASHQYRATIESPVYQLERFLDSHKPHSIDRWDKHTEDLKNTYSNLLADKLARKSCIVIGSADVNPLTEVSLGGLYGVPQKDWFSSGNVIDNYGYAVAGVKEVLCSETRNFEDLSYPIRLFYQALPVYEHRECKRGFLSSLIPTDRILMQNFVSQNNDEKEYVCFAHLAIGPNPFVKDFTKKNTNWLVILNGITGPATFAAAHILTGVGPSAVSKEFVNLEKDSKPEFTSESILRRITEEIDSVKQRDFSGLQYFIRITVKPPHIKQPHGGISLYDWRRISKWEIVEGIPSGFKVVEGT